ncbi:hypothetical protein A1OS_15090 [Enterovibrio norvegicus]|nr:hypothetical protein A1OS_15090 [Enterovibrio norvegicus]
MAFLMLSRTNVRLWTWRNVSKHSNVAEQLVAVIEKRKQWIADERQRLEAYAKAQAKKSCQCPKCGGTGV